MLKEFNLYHVLTAKDILRNLVKNSVFLVLWCIINTVWYSMYYIS